MQLGMLAPVSVEGVVGMRRAEVKQGVRRVILCKDGKGKLGLRIKAVSKVIIVFQVKASICFDTLDQQPKFLQGIFVAFVSKNSPAAMGGIRFGDQILQIDEETVAGYSTDKVAKILKKSNPQRVDFAIRDRFVHGVKLIWKPVVFAKYVFLAVEFVFFCFLQWGQELSL